MTARLVPVKPFTAAPMTQAMSPTPRTESLSPDTLQRLCQLARLGDFDEALAILAGAELGTSPAAGSSSCARSSPPSSRAAPRTATSTCCRERCTRSASRR